MKVPKEHLSQIGEWMRTDTNNLDDENEPDTAYTHFGNLDTSGELN